MTDTTRRGAHAAMLTVAIALCAPLGAAAQVKWCCDNPSHAGGTAAERCDKNKMTFASADECAAHKTKHDGDTGHSSTCSGAVPQTRKGTAGGGSRAIGSTGG